MLELEFANMAAYTSLVEACDWDESQADAVIDTVTEFLNDLKPTPDMTWELFRDGLGSYVTRLYDKQISDIIITILEAKAKEIKFYMELEDD